MFSDFVSLSAEMMALSRQGKCASNEAWKELMSRVDLAKRTGDIDEVDYRWLVGQSRG